MISMNVLYPYLTFKKQTSWGKILYYSLHASTKPFSEVFTIKFRVVRFSLILSINIRECMNVWKRLVAFNVYFMFIVYLTLIICLRLLFTFIVCLLYTFIVHVLRLSLFHLFDVYHWMCMNVWMWVCKI